MNHKTLLVAVSLAAFSTAHAAVQSTVQTNTAGFGTYASQASALDLINTGASTLLSMATPGTYGPLGGAPELNNGSITELKGAWASTFSGGTIPFTVTAMLNTSVNTAGYDITGINSFAGWNDPTNFHFSLGNQKFMLEVRSLASGTWTTVGTFTMTGTDGINKSFVSGNGNISSMIAVTDTSGKVASGVDGVRFTLMDVTVPGGAAGGADPMYNTMYQEIDVIGTATAVPEPSTYGLMGAGALAAITFVRRRRKQA